MNANVTSPDLRIPDHEHSRRTTESDSNSTGADPVGSILGAVVRDIVAIDDWCVRTSARVERMDAELFELCASLAGLVRTLSRELGHAVEPDDDVRARSAVATRIALQAIHEHEILEREAREPATPEEFRSWFTENLDVMFPPQLTESIDYRTLYSLVSEGVREA